jgi:hypothetical protein
MVKEMIRINALPEINNAINPDLMIDAALRECGAN